VDREFLTGLGVAEESVDAILQKNNEELDLLRIDNAISNIMLKKGTKNLEAAMKLFDKDGISICDGQIVGVEEKIEEFVKNNDFLFQNDSKPVFSAPTNNSKPQLTKDEFSKMGYNKRLKLFNENPNVYKELTKE
jgi:hypothetical protein